MSREVRNDADRARVVRQVLDLLIGDGYLIRYGDAVRFRSALVRRYWREVQG
jgi:hypothetical protein